MRRKDREITSFESICEIIEECNVIRIGLCDEDLYPYIVPMNFGYEIVEGEIFFYIHGAMAGRKYELMKKNGVCSFEMDCAHQLVLDDEMKEATMLYKSVMGKAEIEFLEDEEKIYGLDLLMKKDKKSSTFDYSKSAAPRTAVIRLKVTQYTGKSNPGKRG